MQTENIKQLKIEKEQIESENKKLKTERDEMSQKKSELTKGIEKERELTGKLKEKAKEIMIQKAKDMKEMETLEDNKKYLEQEIEKMITKMGTQEETLQISTKARLMLEDMVREREREIKRLKEKEQYIEKLYKEEKEKNNKEKQIENDKKEKEGKEIIRKGGYEICYFYLKERCLKLDRCKYIHPPICRGASCQEECWMVHKKDLEIDNEIYAKRGAVPYKMEGLGRTGRKDRCKFYDRGECWKGDKCQFRHIIEQQDQPLRRPNIDVTKQKEIEKNGNLKKSENEEEKRSKESTEDLQKILDEIDEYLNPKN